MNDKISLTKTDGIAIIKINRPKYRNALDGKSINEFANVVAVVEADKTIQVLVLAGGGGTFCAGAPPGRTRVFCKLSLNLRKSALPAVSINVSTSNVSLSTFVGPSSSSQPPINSDVCA